MYKIIGSDGRTYGPATAAQIREWLAQKRVEPRTPVLPEGAAEWTYLGLLPEFSNTATGTPPLIAPPKPARRTNGFATAGFVCGLLSWICCCGCPFNVLGLIFSIVALVQIGNQTDKEDGWGLALAGLICSAVSLLLSLGFGLLQFALTPANVAWHFGSV
jgi:Domain of unknown function (DUF4190)/GYF domain 2